MNKVKVGIYGVGLIGGSLGLALKNFSSDYVIYGFGRNPEKLKIAKKLGAIDYYSVSEKHLNKIDILVLATPVLVMPDILKKVKSYLESSCIITDVGSTKTYVEREIKKIAPEFEFVPAHPMAGSEKVGVLHADPYLFENAVCIICSNPRKKSTKKVVKMWQTTGIKIIYLSSKKHDDLISIISHIPHIVASSLVNLTFKEKLLLTLAAGGFKDTTRIASSDENLWTNIIKTNRNFILRNLKTFLSILQNFQNALEKENYRFIKSFLKKAKERRNSIPSYQKGIIASVYDLVVSVPDKPGVLATLTGLLAKEKINIIDIEVLKVREGYGGSIKFSFLSLKEYKKAKEIFKKNKIKFL